MIVIVDYGMGNLNSVAKAVEFLGYEVKISNCPEDISSASHIILPGVGAFEKAILTLKEIGLDKILSEQVLKNKKPFLGICLGAQLITNESLEGGKFKGLGWIDARVEPLDQAAAVKSIHVGWNDLKIKKDSPILNDIKDSTSFYFVHGYYLNCHDPKVIVGTTTYGIEFPAIIQKGNIFATQFHPEKSQKAGLKILSNFLNWVPDKDINDNSDLKC